MLPHLRIPIRITLLTTACIFGPQLHAQTGQGCVCSDLGPETFREPDTVFHVVDRFDAAFCGTIDRSVQPFRYSGFTLRSCVTVALSPLRIQPFGHDCHITVEGGMLVVDEFRLLPSGADMMLVPQPCWRSNYVLRPHKDTLQYAVNEMRELIADLPKATPEQRSRVQARWDAMRPSIHWTDQELLGQVFLCALSDPGWFQRFTDLRTTFLMSGSMAAYHDELLTVLQERRVSAPQ